LIPLNLGTIVYFRLGQAQGSLMMLLKPRPHQQQCRSNIVKCYKVERCFDIVAGVERAYVVKVTSRLLEFWD